MRAPFGAAPVLSATDLVAGYRRGRRTTPIVSVPQLSAHRGDLVAVVGPNGAGKSTLLRTLIGAQPALAGTVELGGVRLDRLDRLERAKRVAVVLTERVEAGLLTVGEVVLLGRHPHTGWSGRPGADDIAVAQAAADELGVGDLWRVPFGEISDGQRQRVLVARALAQEPTVLVLDEPTAFLDIAGRVELTAALATLAHVGGLTVVASTHDLDLALAHADRVWLVHGATVADDVPEAFVADGRLGAAFDTEQVALDPRTGTFRGHRRAGPPIETDDPLLARLVTRLGATAVSSRDLDASLGVRWRVGRAEGGGWELFDGTATEHATTLGALSAIVRRRLGEPRRLDDRLRS